MEFAASRAGTALVTLHGGADATARDDARTELAATLEGLAADGAIADWEIDAAEVSEHPIARTYVDSRRSSGMEIDLRFFATFRDAVGQKERTRTVDDDATVGDVLAALEDEYEDLEGQLLTADGTAVREQLSVLRNGRNVAHMAGPDTELEDGDVVSVFPPVAGG